MKHRIALSLICAAGLAGCVPANPVVSDFNGDSVKLQTSQFADGEDVAVATQEEANRICGKAGKRAEYASTRPIGGDSYMSEHLYLCL